MNQREKQHEQSEEDDETSHSIKRPRPHLAVQITFVDRSSRSLLLGTSERDDSTTTTLQLVS
ncbi:hypothetical protein KIN20_027660 [Parelaphostrongylus tenuis]|uniref:Uncharacterized protein n=1 Tax=Parelaphostrongylus tenuis TaxID=148309 RepID=A0AAD5WEB3_PARTN|nr:hypothetical protein KIN20_027660 [Parelaphostrongylus tenuis]